MSSIYSVLEGRQEGKERGRETRRLLGRGKKRWDGLFSYKETWNDLRWMLLSCRFPVCISISKALWGPAVKSNWSLSNKAKHLFNSLLIPHFPILFDHGIPFSNGTLIKIMAVDFCMLIRLYYISLEEENILKYLSVLGENSGHPLWLPLNTVRYTTFPEFSSPQCSLQTWRFWEYN